MTDLVVDTSVAFKWVIEEDDSDLAKSVAAQTLSSGSNVVVLDLALIESANALRSRYHRKLIDIVNVRAALQLLKSIPMEVLAAFPLLDKSLEIALNYGIAVYDAAFVAAVDERKCDGITADEPLVAKVGMDFPSIKLLKNWQPSP